MPFRAGKTGYHEQRLPAGTAPKQDQWPWDRALPWPEQPSCPFLRAKQATMTIACRRGSSRSTARGTGTQLLYPQEWHTPGLLLTQLHIQYGVTMAMAGFAPAKHEFSCERNHPTNRVSALRASFPSQVAPVSLFILTIS